MKVQIPQKWLVQFSKSGSADYLKCSSLVKLGVRWNKNLSQGGREPAILFLNPVSDSFFLLSRFNTLKCEIRPPGDVRAHRRTRRFLARCAHCTILISNRPDFCAQSRIPKTFPKGVDQLKIVCYNLIRGWGKELHTQTRLLLSGASLCRFKSEYPLASKVVQKK